jgi:NAD(P)-dependent dehydrogenase (short-subunit alcohol dehydrogenase family)
MSAFSLEGKKILVTGASSGIGKQISVSLAAYGAELILTGRNTERLQETLDLLSYKKKHIAIPFDFINLEQIPDFISQLPKLNGVVHCAGIARYIPFKILTEKEIKLVMTINYEAPVLLTQSLLKDKILVKECSIVFIASISALIGAVATSIYAGSKAALVATTRSLALEIAPQKMRANCISPGIVVTPLLDKVQESLSAEGLFEKEKLHPLGFGMPEDIANATIFLLSDASRWITGTNLIADGGYTCQ